mgnify:CR=1 FL=1|tara:strand:- start:343 stop:654 length:312 start_codon:yes stop_codon:yes gene_type:complete
MSETEISEQILQRIAKIATIIVPNKSQAEMSENLAKVVDLFIAMDKIQVCETKKSDLYEVNYNQLRTDKCENQTTDKSAKGTYCHYDNHSGNFIVPKVIETEG